MQLQSINKVTSRPITWFWPGRFALGKLAMLDGDPGLGKSLLALDLGARLSTGRPFPDDQPGTGIANAIVLNAEDAVRIGPSGRKTKPGFTLSNLEFSHLLSAPSYLTHGTQP